MVPQEKQRRVSTEEIDDSGSAEELKDAQPAKPKEEEVSEVVCQFKNCGRKFPSYDMLKAHVDRRHQEELKEENQTAKEELKE